MPAEVYFARKDGVATISLVQLTSELTQAGFESRTVEDKSGQVWIEFAGYRSRLLLDKEELLGLITFQLSGDLQHEGDLLDQVGDCLCRHGYIDAEGFAE